MRNKLLPVAGLLLIISAVKPSVAQTAPRATTPAEQTAAQVAMAEKLALLAIPPRGEGNVPAPVLRRSAALLTAAMRLNPAESRFPRLLADACAGTGDIEGELAAWAAYRRLVPDDRVAQSRVVELYLSRLQTADAKLNYIKDLLTKPSLAPELKAHFAAIAVPLLEQRSHEEAVGMLRKAHEFYPLPQVLFLEYGMLPKDAAPTQRIAALVNLLKANPAQPYAVAELAHFLTLAGLHEEATPWYATSVYLFNQMGGRIDTTAVPIEYTANLFRTGQVETATKVVESLIDKIDPNSVEAWFLKLTIQRGNESPDQIRLARDVLKAKFTIVRDHLLAPTTQPAAGAAAPTINPSDVTALAARALAVNDPALSRELEVGLGNLAWFELYFAHQPRGATPSIEALSKLVPDSDPMLRRLRGWLDLITGKPAEARQEFAAVADKDALAMLGLYQVESKENAAKAVEIGQNLLEQPTAGVVNAIVFEALKGRNLHPATQPATTAAKAEIDKFPLEWLEVLQPRQPGAPGAAKFYNLRVDPLDVAHRTGDPMLARLTLTNIGTYDLAIGSGLDGVLQPDLWFNASVRGLGQKDFSGLAFDRIMGRTVLRPKETISQVVRIDVRELDYLLRHTPVGMLSVDAFVVTNPLPTAEGVAIAPGGYLVRFGKIFSRISEPLIAEISRKNFFAAMASGPPANRLLDLDLIRTYLTQDAGTPQTLPSDTAMRDSLIHAIDGARGDASPEVAAWAGFVGAEVMPPDRQKVVDALTAGAAPWESRLLGLVASDALPNEQRMELASRLSKDDPDPAVKAYAAGSAELAAHPATKPASPSVPSILRISPDPAAR